MDESTSSINQSVQPDQQQEPVDSTEPVTDLPLNDSAMVDNESQLIENPDLNQGMNATYTVDRPEAITISNSRRTNATNKGSLLTPFKERFKTMSQDWQTRTRGGVSGFLNMTAYEEPHTYQEALNSSDRQKRSKPLTMRYHH